MSTGRTLRIVERPEDAPAPDPAVDILVLDTSWTPGPGGRSDLIAVRPTVRSVVDRVNLFDEALERIDAWGEAAGMADRLMDGGVTWWFHARSFIRLDLHEMLLWCHVLADLAPPGRYERMEIPAYRALLVAAARAVRSATPPAVVTYGPPPIRRSGRPATGLGRITRQGPVGALRRPVGRVLRRFGALPDHGPRMAALEERLATLAAEPGGVMAVVRSASFHVVGTSGDVRRTDPYVTPVLDQLAAAGHPVVGIGLALDHRRDPDWAQIEGEPRLLPMSFVSRRSALPRDDAAQAAQAAARIAATPELEIEVDGYDLGPALRAIVHDLGPWFERQRHGMLWAERIMGELQPSVLFTGWEGARTMWLGAARRLGIPSVAVQHGVIYPNNPDYYRPAHPGLVRPDATCVYGPYERDILIVGGRYEPDSVVVTGSPRVQPDDAAIPLDADERSALRRELGVADGDRLLVVSAARNPIGDEIHSMSMASRLFDGPLPGVHVVVKLHPEEQTGEHYERLVAGLARAGGYEPPRISTVRDVDLYRLLRAADAHLGQYSTVLTDAVLTGTANMVAVGQAYADIIGYVEAGVAVPVRSVDDVRAFMADPRPPAPLDRARFLDDHYLPRRRHGSHRRSDHRSDRGSGREGRLMTRTVAIIQARTGSTRLPGKVLLPLLGEPLLVHVVRRVARAASVDATVVATTTMPNDDAIVDLGAREGWLVERGSETDLLDRYLGAARAHAADRVIRITSDCPLIDPDVIDDVVTALEAAGADYASNTLEPRTFPRGLDVEAMTMVALEAADQADRDPASREHATPYLYRHPERFRLAGVRLPEDLSAHRWTVDTPEDYDLVRRIYDALGRDDFGWLEALAVVRANPAWSDLNRHIEQKRVPPG